MIAAPELIATRRLFLRRIATADAQAAFDAYASDPAVTRFLAWPPAASPGDVARHFAKVLAQWDEGRLFTWSLRLKDAGTLIGMADARVDAYMVNIGYVIGRRYWNAGYATEAVQALCAWADGEPDVARIWAVCAADNPASARVLEKAGLAREETLRPRAVLPNIGGEPRDCVCYARPGRGARRAAAPC
ncbi:MAG TPA: GNAT family N-acetyltransferase [Bacteroidota bacterium]|nr:GNAT family N-acetyltransferase [Bacteroidota bacterium]